MRPGEAGVVLYDLASRAWWRFARPVKIWRTSLLDEVPRLLGLVEAEARSKSLYAVGFVTYEAAPAFDPALKVRASGDLPLAWFGLYHEPVSLEFPPSPAAPGSDLRWQATVTPAEYQTQIRRIKQHIQQGHTYQVNYSYRLQTPFRTEAWDFFTRMVQAQGCCQGVFLETEDWALCSASPELFFSLDGTELVSRPMKGTARRGLWLAPDQDQALQLRQSAKDQAENVMIVDMVRNDLGRVAEYGSVETRSLFEVERHPTVWQMTSTVRGTTRAGLPEIFRALFPAASITGAPKARTMQLIAELESTPRGLYTGAMGFFTPSGRAQFNVAIRTVVVQKQRQMAEYGVGGGIVWDSTEAGEFQECATKAGILTHQYPEFGLLETLLWTPPDGYFLLERHLARLSESAAYFSRSVELAAIRAKLAECAARLASGPHRVRLVVPERGEATVEGQKLPLPPENYRVRLARNPVNSLNPFLYHKTTQRRAYAEAQGGAPEVEDVLLWNEKGELTESCIANLIVEREGRWFTPPVACGLLAGTYRSVLLEQGQMEEQVIAKDDLCQGSQLWLVNSVRGIWRAVLVPA